MSDYRYVATDLLTGVLRADSLPLHVENFGSMLGNVGQPGQLNSYLDLGALGAVRQAAVLGALEPRKTLLWVLQNGYPIWPGIVWSWDHRSAVSNQLPIIGKEFSSLFLRRRVLTDLTFTGDLFAIIRSLLNYTLTKTNGGVSALSLGSATSGVTATATFKAAGQPRILDCLNQFTAQYGIEYFFAPGWDATGSVPQIQLRLGYPGAGRPPLGRPIASTNLMFQYPGNALDYAYPRNGSASVNSLTATATSAGSTPWTSGPSRGQNAADFAAGYPLLEDSVTYTAAAVTAAGQIDAYADNQVLGLSGCTTIPSVTLGGGTTPTVGQMLLGDEAYLVATSSLHPADPTTGAPGLQALLRMIGWTVTPSDGEQVEGTQLYFGGVTT